MPRHRGNTLFTDLLEIILFPQLFTFDKRRWDIVNQGFHARFTVLQDTVRVWLEALELAGVDLASYGLSERQALINDDVRREFCLNPASAVLWDDWRVEKPRWHSLSNQNLTIRLIDIQYGPSPQDWKLWWTEPTDELVGEFWHRIEWQMPRIPGGWIEGDE